MYISKMICTWFGAGLSPKAPGTCGSLSALPLAWIIQLCFGSIGLGVCAVIAFFGGWTACHYYMPYRSAKDPQEIVIDEVAGQWLLLSFLYPTLTSYIAGFILFRLFDVIKPWPISLADRKISGGLGVMLDDILAALYPVAIFVIIDLLGMGSPILAFLAK